MAYSHRTHHPRFDPVRSVPLLRPAARILRPFEPLPSAPVVPYAGPHSPPTEAELRRRELANAEAVLAGLVNALAVARAGIGEANRTHTAPVMLGSRVLMPAQRYSAERMRERKSYAFKLLNRRRGEVTAARHRVDVARAAMNLPALTVLEEGAAAKASVRASKHAVHPIASASA